jgi:hypothetical protein
LWSQEFHDVAGAAVDPQAADEEAVLAAVLAASAREAGVPME